MDIDDGRMEDKNPAFSGNGYSQHVLSIDQLETLPPEIHQSVRAITETLLIAG